MVELKTCRSGALTLDGGKFSSTRTNNSSTGRTPRYLKLRQTETKKDMPSEFTPTMEADTKSGLSFTLTSQRRVRIKDSIRNGASIETDHSTSDLDFQ